MKGALYSLLTRHSELFPCYFHHRLLAIEARVTACGAGVIGSGSFVIATTLPEMMAANCDVTYSTGNPEHLRSAKIIAAEALVHVQWSAELTVGQETRNPHGSAADLHWWSSWLWSSCFPAWPSPPCRVTVI